MNGLQIAAVVCSFLSLLLLIIALASDNWMDNGITYLGLWKTCNSILCIRFGMDVSAFMHATRAFMLIGMFIGAFSLSALGATFFHSQIGSFSMAKTGAIASFCAGICALIAMAVFTGQVGPSSYFGWSFGLGWTSVPLFIITGALAYKADPGIAACIEFYMPKKPSEK